MSKLAAKIFRLQQNITPHHKQLFNDIYRKYDFENIIPIETPLCPHWLSTININNDLHNLPKKSTSPRTFKNLFRENLSLTQTHSHIYTDASILGGQVGMAIIHEDNQIQWKLSEKCFICTVEALAILKAIEYIVSEINLVVLGALQPMIRHLIFIQFFQSEVGFK